RCASSFSLLLRRGWRTTAPGHVCRAARGGGPPQAGGTGTSKNVEGCVERASSPTAVHDARAGASAPRPRAATSPPEPPRCTLPDGAGVAPGAPSAGTPAGDAGPPAGAAAAIGATAGPTGGGWCAAPAG